MQLVEPAGRRGLSGFALVNCGALHLVEQGVVLLGKRRQSPPDRGHVAARHGLDERLAGAPLQAQGDQHVAVALARRLAHGAAERLDDVDVAFPPVHEGDQIGIRHVHPFSQAARARQRRTRGPAILVQQACALPRGERAINVARPELALADGFPQRRREAL